VWPLMRKVLREYDDTLAHKDTEAGYKTSGIEEDRCAAST